MWYAARLLYESVVDDQLENADKLYEEKIIVFKCQETDEARRRIDMLAAEDEIAFRNVEGDEVSWKFKEILEVQEVLDHTIGDGTEVFFRFWHNPDSRDFEMMRRTHEEAWWRAPSQKAGSLSRRRGRTTKTSPARAS